MPRKLTTPPSFNNERLTRLGRIIGDLKWIHRQNDFGMPIPCPDKDPNCPVCATIGRYQVLKQAIEAKASE